MIEAERERFLFGTDYTDCTDNGHWGIQEIGQAIS
jgi:hypothetical protein